MFGSVGWVLLLLTWWWMFEFVWGTEVRPDCPAPPPIEETICLPPENTFVVTTFEESMCKIGTEETVTYRKVERVQYEKDNPIN
jgi:hypothetical protein